MKNLSLLIAIVAIVSLQACAQSSKDVPTAVKTAFTQKFPTATKVSWGMEDKKEWEAEFKMNGKNYSANYDLDGNWLETEYEITQNEIPASVKATLDGEFQGYKVEEPEISESADGKVFEFELKKGGEKMEVAIDGTGKVVKKENLKEHEEGDEENDNEEND